MANMNPKELKSPGTFQLKIEEITDYFEKNKKKAYIGLGVLFAVILISTGWYLYRLDYEKNAQKLYAEAFGTYHLSPPGPETSRRAIQMYSELNQKFPGSRAAASALFSIGNLFYGLNDFDRSIQAYKDFLNASGIRKDLRSMAYNGLGYCYDAKGDLDKALEFYEKSIQNAMGGAVLSATYSNMAGIYLEKKNREKALEYYKKAQKQKSDPVMDAMIKRKISELET
jgi:tetratricopeptide (TPR) repeat protein